MGIEKGDYFYKHLGDRIDRIGSGGTKDKEELQRISRCYFRFEQRSGWWKGNGFGAEQIVCSMLNEFQVLVRNPSRGVGQGLECS